MARSLALAFGAFGGLMVAASPVPVRAQALPQGGVVVNGSATISQTGNRLTVVNTPGAAINWQSFNIGAGNTAHFQQQSAASSVLNRVIGPDPSQIYGALTSNGRVVLINPAGIAFGAGAAVDTAGFVASTVNISDADWRAGRLRFAEPGSGGTIQLLGANGQVPAANIRAQGGDIVLIAPQVDIASGAVAKATGGDVIIAAGRSVELTGRGYEGIRLLVQAPTDRATNLGKLEGDAVSIFAKSLKNFGSVQATGTTIRDGRVMLVATDSAEVGGQITANRTVNGSNTGGNVTVLANTVSLQGASIDASGANAGGQVNIGGNWQGRGDPLPDAPQALAAVGGAANAQNTQVDAATRINASSTNNGNGGQVVVWADGRTDFAGSIEAKGGAQGGNGGQVEVSGKQVLKFADSGRVDTSAPMGQWGGLLLDPADLTIAPSGGDITGTAVGGLINSNADLTITSASGTLGGTSGNIFINDNISWTSSTNRVTFLADSDIHLNGTLSNTNAITFSPAVTFLSNSPTGTLYFGSTADARIDVGTNAFVTSTIETRTNVGRTADLKSGFTVFQAKTWVNSGTVNFAGAGMLRLNSFPPTVDGQFINNNVVNVSLSPGGTLAEGRPSNFSGGLVSNAGTMNFLAADSRIRSQFSNTGTINLSPGHQLTLEPAPTTLTGRLSFGAGSQLLVPAFTVVSGGAGSLTMAGAVNVKTDNGISITGASLQVSSLTLEDTFVGTGAGGINVVPSVSTTPPGITGAPGGGAVSLISADGNITVGSIVTDGRSGTGGGGNAGNVSVVATGSGAVSLGAVSAQGGGSNPAVAGQAGGAGGTVMVSTNTGNITIASVNANGGTAANNFVGAGGNGGAGGSITLARASGSLSLAGSFVADGGNGGAGVTVASGGGAGGQGGMVSIAANGGGLTFNLASGAEVSVRGGAAGVDSSANGGAGGSIQITATGSLNISGANFMADGGASQSTSLASAGTGGQGGTISVGSGSGVLLLSGTILSAEGGWGNDATLSSSQRGGHGGQGGTIRLTSGGGQNLSLAAGGGVLAIQLSARGGSGGDGGTMTPGGTAGNGGLAGQVSVVAGGNLQISDAEINAGGGEGGDNWSYPALAGFGGNANLVHLRASSGNLTVGGSSDFSAGFGYGGLGREASRSGSGGEVRIEAPNGSIEFAGGSHTVGGLTLRATAQNNLDFTGTTLLSSPPGLSVNGGNVTLTSTNGGVITIGTLLVGGGGPGSAEIMPTGASGGNVLIRSLAGNLSLAADGPGAGISVAGAASDAEGGSGGNGGSVTISSAGGLTVAPGLTVDAFGADGVNGGPAIAAGGAGGQGGQVTLTSAGLGGGVFAPDLAINVSGGAGGSGHNGPGGFGGVGGAGGSVAVTVGSAGAISFGGADVFAKGGNGGGGASNSAAVSYGGGNGGAGGSVIFAAAGGGGILVDSPIAATGGAGGDASFGNPGATVLGGAGMGGSGGTVSIGGGGTSNATLSGTAYAVNVSPGTGGFDQNGVQSNFYSGSGGMVAINAAAGDVEVASQISALNLVVSAQNNVTLSGFDASSGGNGPRTVTLESSQGGTIAVGGLGGNASGTAGNSLAAPGAGGSITVRSLAGNLTVTGGLSAQGGVAYTSTGQHGGNGGQVTIASAGSLDISGLSVSVPGNHGAAAPSTVAAPGGNGGNGGTVVVTAAAGINAAGFNVNAQGGASGLGGDPDPVTAAGALSGRGGDGGSVSMSSTSGLVALSGSAYYLDGGNGADASTHYSAGGGGGAGGALDIATGGNVSITSSSGTYISVQGGSGGNGGLSTNFIPNPSVNVAYAGGAGGNGGSVSIRSNGGGNVSVGAAALNLLAAGGQGGDAGQAPMPPAPPYTMASGGSGGDAGGVTLGSGNTNSLILNGNVWVDNQPGFQGLDSAGVDPANSGIYSALTLASGAGGISQAAPVITGGAGMSVVFNSAGPVNMAAANAFHQVTGSILGSATIFNDTLYNMQVSSLTVGGNASFQGQTVSLGNVSAGGSLSASAPSSVQVFGGVLAAGDVNLTSTSGSVLIGGLTSVTGSSVSLAASGAGANSTVYVYSPVTSTVGDVSINATGLVRAQTGGSINSARDVLISGGPGTAASDPQFPNAAVAIGSGLGAGGGAATQVVAARNVSISTGGGDLVVQAEQAAIPNYSAKLVSAADMTLDLGGGALHIKGGTAAGSFALVDPTNPGSQMNITAGAINITGGGAAGAYAGLASFGDINTIAPITVNAGAAGALVVAPNVATIPGLTIPPGSAAGGAMVVDPNTGAVTVGGLPWAGGAFIAGLPGAAFAPVAPAPAPTVITNDQVQNTILNNLIASQSAASGSSPSPNDTRRRLVNGVVVTDSSCTPGT